MAVRRSEGSSTRERIVRAANDLFYAQGFHGVGLDQITEAAGVTKTTLYNHFESKEDLVRAVLEWHDRWWRDEFREMLRRHGGDTARGQLLGVFDALGEMFEGEGYNGCFFVNVAVQFPLAHDPAHRAAATHKRAMCEILRELAGYAGAEDAELLAQEVSMVIEGAYVTRQVTGEARTAEIGRRLLEMVVERRLGAGRA